MLHCLVCLQGLSTYQLDAQQAVDPQLDLLTGFQLADGALRLVVLEGPADGVGMAKTVAGIARWVVRIWAGCCSSCMWLVVLEGPAEGLVMVNTVAGIAGCDLFCHKKFSRNFACMCAAVLAVVHNMYI
jgi:hypothetical protein